MFLTEDDTATRLRVLRGTRTEEYPYQSMGHASQSSQSRAGAAAASRSAVFGLTPHCSPDLAGGTGGGGAFCRAGFWPRIMVV